MNKATFLSSRKIGVIGYGMFGKFLCEELLKDLEIFLYSRRTDLDLKSRNIKRVKSLEELAEKSDFIIPCVPINKFEKIILELKPHLRQNTIIMDICSVKLYPVDMMSRHLPDSIQKIASHPMFGPYSFHMRGSVAGFPMVMSNAGCDSEIYSQTKQYFSDLGLQIAEITPDEHDQLAARSHFFSQLTRASAVAQDLQPTFIDTPAASLMFEAFNHMNISEELLIDMLNYNKYSKKVLDGTISSMNRIKKEAEEKNE